MYYGFRIMVILCFDYLIMLCGTLYTYGTYVSEMVGNLNMTMTEAAFGQTLLTLLSAVIGMAVGQMLNVYIRPKKVLLAGAVFGMIGSFCMAFLVNGPMLYYICFGIFFSMMNVCGSGVGSHVIANNWFPDNRSTALAVLMSMGGVGGFIFPTLTAKLIEISGSWRTIWFVVGGGCVICFVITLLFLHDTPEAMGLQPMTSRNKSRKGGGNRNPESFTRNEALKTAFFYASTLLMVCMTMGVYVMSHTFVTNLCDHGIEKMSASKALSLYAAFNIIGRLSAGPLLDRVNPRIVHRICAAGLCVCLLILPKITTVSSAMLFACFMGTFISFGVMCPMNVCMNTYGVKYYSQIYSVQTMVNTLINSSLMLFAGSIHDTAGSYTPYYRIMVFAALAVCLIQFVIHEPKRIPEAGDLCSMTSAEGQ